MTPLIPSFRTATLCRGARWLGVLLAIALLLGVPAASVIHSTSHRHPVPVLAASPAGSFHEGESHDHDGGHEHSRDPSPVDHDSCPTCLELLIAKSMGIGLGAPTGIVTANAVHTAAQPAPAIIDFERRHSVACPRGPPSARS
ncbi:MAG: hypothetical protein IT435_04670 [Phycisphaerales bacterium]|nr:hypothetical protein [Phycisphaerales bacterium]